MGILVKLIRLLNDALKLTTIIVSHDVEETASIADYIYVISDGKIQGEGTPDELRNNGSDWVKQFMQGSPDGPVPFHYPAKNIAKIYGESQRDIDQGTIIWTSDCHFYSKCRTCFFNIISCLGRKT